jgi:hypothetical protein
VTPREIDRDEARSGENEEEESAPDPHRKKLRSFSVVSFFGESRDGQVGKSMRNLSRYVPGNLRGSVMAGSGGDQKDSGCFAACRRTRAAGARGVEESRR